jgi:periplasmic protein TonB
MPKKNWMKYLPALLGALIVIAAVVAMLLVGRLLHKDKVEQKKMVQQVTILNPPLPPPPPPPQEKPPEVKEEEIPPEEVEEAAPDNAQEEAPGQDLGVDAEGAAGGDSFGLVGKKGGRGILGGGGYEQFVRQEINEFIVEEPRLKHMAYVANVTLQISDSGEFEKFDVELVSGDQEALQILKKIIADKRRLSRPKPLEAASLVKLRIKSVL